MEKDVTKKSNLSKVLKRILFGILALALIVSVLGATFQVQTGSVAIVKTFGKAVGVKEPGLQDSICSNIRANAGKRTNYKVWIWRRVPIY